MELNSDAVAVLNAREPSSARLASRTNARVVRYLLEEGSQPASSHRPEAADVRASAVVVTSTGSTFTLDLAGEPPRQVALSLVGLYNVENALTAAGIAHGLGFDGTTIVRGLEALRHVPGRLEPVDIGQSFRVLIDYAHTDDALEKVLTALRTVAPQSRPSCVFGCGGDRNRTKRPRMGRVAERLADKVFITSDNPRSEDPAAIIEDVLRGLERPRDAVVEPDRSRAIEQAIGEARDGDVLLIAGKGHETYQIIGNQTIPFDDREVAREALLARLP